MKLPTVKIVAYGNFKKTHEYLIINESDFDSKKHTLWADRDKLKSEPQIAPKKRGRKKEEFQEDDTPLGEM